MNILQLDGTILAPTNSKAWGLGLLQWLEFKKLVGITIQGKGIIDGRGSVWWQDSTLDDPTDDEAKLMIPLNNTVSEDPPVIYLPLSKYRFLNIHSTNFSQMTVFGRRAAHFIGRCRV